MLQGVELHPGDLDIVPSLTAENLTRLAMVIAEVGGIPESLGSWSVDPNGELQWQTDSTDPADLARWRPDPLDPDSFDHRFLSRLGDFDVVPRLAGEFSVLDESAKDVLVDGFVVRIASIEELLSTLTVPRRPKDAERVRRLRDIQRALRRPGSA